MKLEHKKKLNSNGFFFLGNFLFIANNNYEVIIIESIISNDRLILFWKIGKFVFEQQNLVENATSKYSTYFQYRYGMTECFSRENIRLMRRLYVYFPILTRQFISLRWEHFLELLKISDCSKRMFYYQVTLFLKCSIFELNHLINNYFYERI